MATPNANNAEYNPGSTADQDARVRRDERIRLVAERDRVMRDLQQLRATVAQEVRTLQALGSPAKTGAATAQRQAAVVAMERRVEQLEQALAATEPETEALTQQDEGPEFGVGPSLRGRGATEQRDTTDIRRGVPGRQLAGQASFRQVSSPQGPTAPSATVQTQREQPAPLPAGTAAASGARQAARTALQQRLSTLKVGYDRGNAEVKPELKKLSKTHPPSLLAFGVIFLLAVGIDILNFFVDVAIVADLVLSAIFFLCIRSLINRSVMMQMAIAGTLLLGILVSVTIPIFGSLIGGPMILFVCLFGLWNPGVSVHKVDKDKITKSMQKFSRTIAIARQNAARLIRFGRRTKGLRTVTTKIARSKAFKAFSKNSKTTGRLLGSALAESIDFIAWIPFNTVNVFLTYSDLKRSHEEAGKLLEEYRQQEQTARSIETDMILEQYQAQVAGMENAYMEAEEMQEAQEMAQPAPSANIPARPPTAVRDVAQPGSPAAPVARPPTPRPLAVPMRDVAVAA